MSMTQTRARILAAAAVALAVVLLVPLVARADFPYPKPPPGTDPNAFARYAFLPQKDPPVLPNDFGDDWKLSSSKSGEAAIDSSPQELFGVRGASVDKAWQVTTGRPDIRISVLDSGIRWQEALPTSSTSSSSIAVSCPGRSTRGATTRTATACSTCRTTRATRARATATGTGCSTPRT